MGVMQYWCLTSAKVLLDPELADRDKTLFTFMVHRLHGRGRCWQTQEAIAGDMGWSRSTVQRGLAALAKRGLLDVETKATSKGRRNIYRLCSVDPYPDNWSREVERRLWGSNRDPEEDLKTPPDEEGGCVTSDATHCVTSDATPGGVASKVGEPPPENESLPVMGQRDATTKSDANMNSTSEQEQSQHSGAADASRPADHMDKDSAEENTEDNSLYSAMKTERTAVVKEQQKRFAKLRPPKGARDSRITQLAATFLTLIEKNFPDAPPKLLEMEGADWGHLKNLLEFCDGDVVIAESLATKLVGSWALMQKRFSYCRSEDYPSARILNGLRKSLLGILHKERQATGRNVASGDKGPVIQFRDVLDVYGEHPKRRASE